MRLPEEQMIVVRVHFFPLNMVIVAELVKRLIVGQLIVGSSPTLHTKNMKMKSDLYHLEKCSSGETVNTSDLKSVQLSVRI